MTSKTIIIAASLLAAISSCLPAKATGRGTDSGSDSDWVLIWSEEFDRDSLDTTKWSYMRRGRSVWSRFIAMGEEARAHVNRFEDGIYKSYCEKTPERFTADNKEMVSGAIFTAGKFGMRGGYIEARCKTIPHPGNFQAFWLMPDDRSGGWPVCGEIDVWEQIDDEQTAYQTLHHALRYPEHPAVKGRFTPVKDGETYTGSVTNDIDGAQWHVYGVEWDAEHITFYIDGKETGSILNPHLAEGTWTEDVTWPFDKSFYVILNQSVGNGSWAKAPDPDFRYQTDFDYVRAYQKRDRIDYHTSEQGHVTSLD